MKTLTWQKPGQQNVAQELIKIIINYVAELRFIIFSFPIYYDKLRRKYFLIVHFYLLYRGTIASSVRNKSMHTEEHFVGFKAMNGSRIEKDVYLVWLYAILDCFLYAHAFIYTVYFLVCYFLTGYFPVEY